MFRGLIRETPNSPAAEQRAILLAVGVPERAIYTDDLPGATKSLRRDNRLVVAGLYALGADREEIEAAIEAVHKRNAAVMDAATKRTTAGKHRKALVDEAVKALADSRRGPRKNRDKGKMPMDQVAAFWFNKLLTDDEVMKAVNGDRRYRKRRSHTSIWRVLGKRNGLIGRRSKKKQS